MKKMTGPVFRKLKSVPAAAMLVFSVSLLLSCGRPAVVTVESSSCGDAVLFDRNSGTLYTVVSRVQEELLFREKPSDGEIEKAACVIENGMSEKDGGGNFIGTKPLLGVLDLCRMREGKCETLLPGFASYDPAISRGILDSAPKELLKGDQNMGRIGILLPLYKAGLGTCDWAVFDPAGRTLHSLGSPGAPAAELSGTMRCGGESVLYRGEREYAITHPSWPVAATLSHEGKMVLFSWPDCRKLYEAQGVYSFCFHPSLKILYYGSKEGLLALNWEKSGKERVRKLSREPVRMIRISSKGSYLFTLGIGGRPRPAVIALTRAGLYAEEPLELGKKYGEASDWTWLDDKILFIFFKYPGSAFYWELNARKGEFSETVLDNAVHDVSVIASNASPTIVKTDSSSKNDPFPVLEWYDPAAAAFRPVRGMPEKKRALAH